MDERSGLRLLAIAGCEAPDETGPWRQEVLEGSSAVRNPLISSVAKWAASLVNPGSIKRSSGPTCLMCRLVAGAAARFIVYESPKVIATLAGYRVRPGHVRVIPREHVTSLDALALQTIAEVDAAAQALSPVLCKLFRAKRSAYSFYQDGDFHVHANLLPIVTPSDMATLEALRQARAQPVDEAELLATVKLIRRELTGSGAA
jgi:histidine triad (HIT) family protein